MDRLKRYMFSHIRFYLSFVLHMPVVQITRHLGSWHRIETICVMERYFLCDDVPDIGET